MEVLENKRKLDFENSEVPDKGEERNDAKSKDTLFKTLSRNHYNLLRMVDNKAAIILTVNSILISFLGALLMAPDGRTETIAIFFSALIYFCIASMIFALLSMMPHKYSGAKFRQSGYKGSLYAGNFSEASFEEFQAEYNRITASGKSVFEEITKDLYFLGRTIKYKQNMIKGAVGSLLLGLVFSGVYTLFQS